MREYGRYRVYVEIREEQQAIGNDYSRDMELDAFARRYIVQEAPSATIPKHSPKTCRAIASARILPGMTRELIFMALGCSVSSENPNLDAKPLRCWLSSFGEFQVIFDVSGRIKEVTAGPMTGNPVSMDRPAWVKLFPFCPLRAPVRIFRTVPIG